MDARAEAVPHGKAALQLLSPHKSIVLGKQMFHTVSI